MGLRKTLTSPGEEEADRAGSQREAECVLETREAECVLETRLGRKARPGHRHLAHSTGGVPGRGRKHRSRRREAAPQAFTMLGFIAQ